VSTESLSDAALPKEPKPKTSNRVKVLAGVGGAILALQLYVWVRWITGPYFERAPQGPSEPPLYMKIPLMANAVVL